MSKESIQKITKGIIYNGLSTGVVTVLGLATSIMLARYFGKNEYGNLIIAYTVISFFTIFTNFGVGSAIVRFLPKYITNEDYRRLNVFTLSAGIIVLSLSAFFSTILFFCAKFVASYIFNRPEAFYIIQIGSIYLFFYSVSYFMSCVFQGFQNWKVEALLSVSPPLIYISGILLVTLIGITQIDTVLIANTFACFMSIVLGVFFLIIGKHIRIPDISFKELSNTMKEIFAFSSPLLFSAFTFYLMIWFDRLILGASRSNEELTVYYIATTIINGLMMMFKVLLTVLTPFVAEIDPADYREVEEKFQLFFKWFLYISLSFSIALFYIVDPLINRAYGEDWSSSASIIKVLLLVFILRCASNPIHMFLINVFQQTKEIAKIGSLIVITNVVLNMALIPFFGYWGAVVSTTAAFFIAWIYMAVHIDIVKKLLPVHLIKKSFFSIGCIVLVNLFCHFIGFYNGFFMFIISFSLFVLLQWLQGEIKTSDIEFCRKLIKANLAHS